MPKKRTLPKSDIRNPKSHASFVLWFTGLSGSGKSTLADAVSRRLKRRGLRVERLDGDTVRSVFPQTGFDRASRNEHIRRIGYLASILERNGIIVIASFISPYRESRDFVRSQCKRFVEVFVDAPMEVCEERDVKGLYKKARNGEIANFTGIDDPYEAPSKPELIIRTDEESVQKSTNEIMQFIRKKLRIN